MNSILIIQLVLLSAAAAYPMAWLQARLAQWVATKTPGTPIPAPVSIHRSAFSFFIRAVILIAMLVLFRYLLSE